MWFLQIWWQRVKAGVFCSGGESVHMQPEVMWLAVAVWVVETPFSFLFHSFSHLHVHPQSYRFVYLCPHSTSSYFSQRMKTLRKKTKQISDCFLSVLSVSAYRPPNKPWLYFVRFVPEVRLTCIFVVWLYLVYFLTIALMIHVCTLTCLSNK